MKGKYTRIKCEIKHEDSDFDCTGISTIGCECYIEVDAAPMEGSPEPKSEETNWKDYGGPGGY